MRCLCFLLSVWGLGFCSLVGAQTAPRPVTPEQWERATQGLDYSKDVPPPPPKSRTTRTDDGGLDWTLNTRWWGNLAQGLAIVLLVVLVGFGIYYMLQQPQNTRIARDGVEITLDNVEQYLDETDLEPFLQKALADKDYAQAIRLYYLRVIQGLSTHGYLQWAREKTNRTYLREMRPHADFPAFQTITRTYERVWYGNATLSTRDFEQAVVPFRTLVEKLRTP